MSEIWKNEKERIEDFRQYAGDIIKEEKIGVLADMGYFTLPASIGHHGKEEGDLYLHSKTVARLLEEFTRKEHLLWSRPGALGPFLCDVLTGQIQHLLQGLVTSKHTFRFRHFSVLAVQTLNDVCRVHDLSDLL